MVLLPPQFLEWNYYARRNLLQEINILSRKDLSRMFLEFTRHNPVLCTAALSENGKIEVNGKVVGCGYVPKREYIQETIKAFREHLKTSDEVYPNVKDDKRKLREFYERHSDRGRALLLKYIYLERKLAQQRIDFEKLATIELAKQIDHSSKHTWRIVQRNKTACLVFFQPPSVSFEVRGIIEIHVNDDYHEIVNLIHDAYHYTPPEKRKDRPVYILKVQEVYDNGPSVQAFGRRIA